MKCLVQEIIFPLLPINGPSYLLYFLILSLLEIYLKIILKKHWKYLTEKVTKHQFKPGITIFKNQVSNIRKINFRALRKNEMF